MFLVKIGGICVNFLILKSIRSSVSQRANFELRPCQHWFFVFCAGVNFLILKSIRKTLTAGFLKADFSKKSGRVNFLISKSIRSNKTAKALIQAVLRQFWYVRYRGVLTF